MRVLWVSPFLPRPDATHAGGRAMYQWLTKLSEVHDITLLCRADARDLTHADPIRCRLHAMHVLRFDPPSGGLSRLPRLVASYARLGWWANRLLEGSHFDILHVDYVEAGLGIDRTLPVPRVLIAYDELSEPARRRMELARELGGRMRRYAYWRAVRALERRICRKFDRVLAASERDRRRLQELVPGLAVAVLPFPVGIDPMESLRAEDRLLFVGAMHRDVNVDAMLYFAQEILPLIRAERPAIRLTIVGNDPPDAVRRLGADPGITITGFVPALEPYYAAATVFVSPLRIGGGIILKNLDAMAAGCPVVTTTIGNEGIGATPGVHLLTADTPAAFAHAVVRLLKEPSERRRLVASARAFVRARFTVELAVERLEETYRALCPGNGGGRLGRTVRS